MHFKRTCTHTCRGVRMRLAVSVEAKMAAAREMLPEKVSAVLASKS